MNHATIFKWSSCPGELNIPETPVSQIKRLHIYDFDNTLYKTPGPSRILYTNRTVGRLMSNETLTNGSWWDQPCFLEESFKMCVASTKERFWNEKMISLASLSYKDPETISLVLTGRKQALFADLIEKMLDVTRKLAKTKKLNKNNNLDDVNEDENYSLYEEWETDPNFLKFNAICLKKKLGRIPSILPTFQYKSDLIADFIRNYPNLEEITIYDDRLRHIKQFKLFFQDMRPRPKFQWFVIPVPQVAINLDPVAEYSLVHKVIKEYNELKTINEQFLEIKWTPKCTGFFLTMESQRRILKHAFLVSRKSNLKRILNLSEYPMYIPICEPGQSISLNTIAEMYVNDENAATSLEFLQKFYNQRKSENRKNVEFIVTHFSFKPIPSPREREGLVYFKVRPKIRSTKISTSFEKGTPLIIAGHLTEEPSDKYIRYEFTDNYMRENKMIWTPLIKTITIDTTFGNYSKMRF
ncbi:similar to Saccharomyces cerevisiae YMR265C Putative protein of unknown function [Maudiozyma saulgeensis]|uniref:Uncharacterized protein n=1 Tax=Maudiozyma saulgeensis TaxID=1789683 RepID=A0A1X7R8X7_9SACH|nr:similar to Saccharomyces cerevisiae YMR265C Putative protein of unknown function [Kazachstania saulgeensis]